MLSSDKHFGWIVILDGRIIGYMDVVFRTYHFAFEFVARIETTIVDEKYRRMGIATKLIKKCEEKAKRLGCKVIELDSAMHRIAAHKFYKKNGYTKRGYTLWKHL
jgi:GNAT superfamily N-acetyltransferase